MAPRRLMDMSTVVLLVAFTVYLSPATARSSTGGGSTPGKDALSTGGGNTAGGETLVTNWQGDSDAHPNRRLLDSERCGVANDSLIGGEDPGVRDYPWLAFLQYQTSRGCRFSCKGALINSRYVLTAAHCVKGIGNTKLVGVRLGEHNLNVDPDCQQKDSGRISGSQAEDFGIAEVIPHQQYMPESSSKLNDIALIRLDRQASYTDFIRPICLPGGAAVTNRYEGSKLTVPGQEIKENSSSSNVKLWLHLPVVANEECAAIYAKRLQLNANHMCAGGLKGKDTCYGDAGGPLMSYESVVKGRPGSQWVSTGIVSIGPALCGTEGKPGIYTRVGPYVNWILDQMKP